YEVVFPRTLDAGSLDEKFDVLIFVDGSLSRGTPGLDPERIPEEYRDRLGAVTRERTAPALRAFLEGGGRIAAIGSATQLAQWLGLPIENALVERTAEGVRPLPREWYYVPGSVRRVRADTRVPVAHGMPEDVDVYFNNSPVFRLPGDAAAHGITPIAWFASKTPLRSGWAWGQHYLEGGVTMAQARVGKGTLY